MTAALRPVATAAIGCSCLRFGCGHEID